ncbi:hypothetical protein X777_03506 [Ooceraea biroi]|uniref:Uncharacterized protein n=1 Tax=Ooceraea biroi TaxID=2015173 RepID=A0A026WM48_OOCBI|nr:hypothetical protein X777_03506 [Ooceraea biroi]
MRDKRNECNRRLWSPVFLMSPHLEVIQFGDYRGRRRRESRDLLLGRVRNR